MAEELLWSRFAKLPLTHHEKGCIYADIQDVNLDELKKLLPDFLEDEAVASSLRKRYMKGEETGRTPPKPELIDLLKRQKLKRGSILKEAIAWVEELPISFSTKRFLISHLYEVTDQMQINCAHSTPQSYIQEGSSKPLSVVMRRKDYLELFRSNKRVKLLLLIGRRRQGKTCALGMEVVHVRKENCNIQDKVIFYHAGENDIPPQRINTILLVLAYMGIVACWDEFPLILENLSIAYKILIEDIRVELDPLSVVLWGSSETLIRNKGAALMSGLQSRGVFYKMLPQPNLETVIGMFYISRGLYHQEASRQKCWDSELFLQVFASCGYNLADYTAGRSYSDLDLDGVAEVSSLSGAKLSAVKQILANDQKVAHIDTLILSNLKKEQIIEDRTPGMTVNFLDPPLRVLSYLKYNHPSTCKVVEGHVFEVMVRGKHLLLPRVASFIAQALDKPSSDVLSCAMEMRHGIIVEGTDCELDGFFRCGDVAVVLGVKRLKVHQSWVELEKKLEKAWNAWKAILDAKDRSKQGNIGSKKKKKPHAGWMLFEAKSILYVAISAIDKTEGKSGSAIGEGQSVSTSDKETSASPIDKGESVLAIDEGKSIPAIDDGKFVPAGTTTSFHDKPVKKLSCTLWELVKDIEPDVLKLEASSDVQLADRLQGSTLVYDDISDNELNE